VAPPGNQAVNRENKLQPVATEGPGLLDPSARFTSLGKLTVSGCYDLRIEFATRIKNIDKA
jgi:hypothetical protein